MLLLHGFVLIHAVAGECVDAVLGCGAQARGAVRGHGVSAEERDDVVVESIFLVLVVVFELRSRGGDHPRCGRALVVCSDERHEMGGDPLDAGLLGLPPQLEILLIFLELVHGLVEENPELFSCGFGWW